MFLMPEFEEKNCVKIQSYERLEIGICNFVLVISLVPKLLRKHQLKYKLSLCDQNCPTRKILDQTDLAGFHSLIGFGQNVVRIRV